MLGRTKAGPAHFGKRKAMQIRVQCPACEASFEVPTALVGRDGECSQCRKVFRVTPLSGEVDPSVLTSGDSNATLEIPIVDDNRPAPDTDEFEIPEIPESPPEAAKPAAPELDVPELDVPELLIPAAPRSESKIEESAAALPQLGVQVEAASEEELPPVLIEDDGSLFGDEIPELEDIPDPISPYASEDKVDPDAGGSYSLSGSSSAPEKRKAKKARRKKSTKKKAATRRSDRPSTAEDDSRATSDHASEVDEVQLFDDVLHDDDAEDAGPRTSPVMLRRSGTFSTPGKPTATGGGKSAESTGRQSEKRDKRKPAARAALPDSDLGEQSGKPVLKRRSSEDRPAPSRSEASAAPKPQSRKKTAPMSPESQQKMIKMVGGGAAVLLLAGAFLYLTSGRPVITPIVQSGGGNSFSNPSSEPAPVPNQDGDIQTGDTNSSVARANRTRTAGGPPRRVDGPADESKEGTDGTLPGTTSETGELTGPDGTPLPGSETPDGQLLDGTVVVARPFSTPTGLVVLPADEANGSAAADPGNFQTEDDKLFPIETVAIPKFPNLGTPRASTISGVLFHEISVVGSRRNRTADKERLPGSQMDMILYLPSGTHERGSLPCVMIAAAGTTLLEGNGCYDESYQSETIPYVKAGFAVLGYSLDGPLESDEPTGRESRAAYKQFRAAHAGLVNSRNSLEFLLQKVPAINRDRIFTAGHSSAGTLSLLFAEHESRLAGCIAYAPCIDVEKRLADFISSAVVEVLMPDVEQFVRQESPLRHFKSLKCPVFLFHAEGDTNAPFDESKEFTARLTAQGTPCKLESVPDGDHYNSMLEEGIPRGIVWLKNSASRQTAEP